MRFRYDLQTCAVTVDGSRLDDDGTVRLDSPGIRMMIPRSWTASCSLALHLLLGELMFMTQRLSSAWHDASVCL